MYVYAPLTSTKYGLVKSEFCKICLNPLSLFTEEVSSAVPSRAGGGGDLGTPLSSRPGTQESEQHLLWLNEEEGSRGGGTKGGRRSPDLLRLNTHAANFKVVRTFDDALDTYREDEVSHHMHLPSHVLILSPEQASKCLFLVFFFFF